jgi:hypothetical protein
MKRLIGVLAALSGVLLASLTMATPANAARPDNGAWNAMTNLNSGRCAAVGNDSRSPGAGLIHYKCDGKYNKRFKALPAGGNLYFLQIRSTGMCVAPQTGADHAVLIQNWCDYSGFAKVWAIEYLGNDSYRLRNQSTGLCMGVAWGVTFSGQPLDQTTCDAFPGQAWRFWS